MAGTTKKISQLTAGGAIQNGDLAEITRSVSGVPTSFKAVLGSMASEDAATFSPASLLGDLFVSVKDPTFGAVGDNTTDDTAAIQAAIDFCFGTTAAPHSASHWLNKALYFPPGRYKISSALTLTKIRGGHIFGAGRYTTTIDQVTNGQAVFVTNGFEFSVVENLQLLGSNSRIFDMSWDGTNSGGEPNLQSNTFRDITFDGGTIGLDLGRGGFMGSETLILNCYFGNCTTAGIRCSNFNALQNQVIGGNIANCGIGIYVQSGSMPLIANVGFQNQSTTDIKVDNSADNIDTMTIIGCRTESTNFFSAQNNVLPVVLVGITQTSAINGAFADLGASAKVTVIGCGSNAGQISGTDPRVTMQGCKFDRSSTFNFGFFSSDDYLELWHCNIAGTEIRHRQLYLDGIAGSGNIQLDWQQKVIKSATSAKTLVASQSGYDLDNTGTAGRVDYTLPSAVAGLEYTFTVTDTDGIRVIPGGGDDIRIAASVSLTGASGHIDSTTIGDSVTLRCRDATHWVAVALVGAGWSVT